MADYTLEQKREAFDRGELWWRFPKSGYPEDRKWMLLSDDIISFDGSCANDPDSEYHIGPTPPRVLTELEQELLKQLKEATRLLDTYLPDADTWPMHNAIAKAEGV